jgi:hypothetical protein
MSTSVGGFFFFRDLAFEVDATSPFAGFDLCFIALSKVHFPLPPSWGA